jgi:hypothetical protein
MLDPFWFLALILVLILVPPTSCSFYPNISSFKRICTLTLFRKIVTIAAMNSSKVKINLQEITLGSSIKGIRIGRAVRRVCKFYNIRYAITSAEQILYSLR